MANNDRQVLANLDVRGLVSRLDRMRKEMVHAQSADLANGLLPPDKDRLLDYISDYKAYLEYVMSVPIPDSPEAHGNFKLDVPDDSDQPAADSIENEDITQILLQCEVYRMEMIGSQSARLVQGFIRTPEGSPGDRQRFLDGIIRIENMVAYVGDTQPSDRPESTPKSLPAQPGR